MKLKHFSKTVVGLVRKANEDHIGSLTNDQTNGNGDIFVVCDGMGGHVGGATASQKAVECILEYFCNDPHSNPILALEKAISFANEQIYLISRENSDLDGMGTTCTALLQKDDNIYIAHVGDSRIYLNTDGKLYRITKDHSFVQKLVDAGQLSDSDMEKHPRKNELTRALGISGVVEVEVSEKPLIVKNGDKFLMCSDGLCGLVNDPTISLVINKENGLNVVEELIQLALNAGGNDNISVDFIEVLSSPHFYTEFKDQTNKRSNLSETQVFDSSTFKKNRSFVYLLNRYKYYALSFILFIILSIYIIPVDFFSFNQNQNLSPSLNSNQENIPSSVIDSTSIDTFAKQEDSVSSVKKLEIDSKNNNLDLEDKVQTLKEKKEQNPIEEKKNSQIANEEFEKVQKTIDQNKRVINIEEENALKKSISEARLLIEKIKKITNTNNIYKEYIELEINSLNNSLETNSISAINNKYQELKKQKKELENRISIEKESNIQFKRYLWDIKKCGIEKQSHYGKGLMYDYELDDNEINKIYSNENKEIISLIKKGYELSDQKEKIVKKEKENEIIVDYKVFFTLGTFNKNKTLFNRFKECFDETSKIYVLKKTN